MTSLDDSIFSDEASARGYIEARRWPDGPKCTRCQSSNFIRMRGRTQAGMLLCRECRSKFSCRMGTAMEHSHVPLHKWLQAVLLAVASDRYLSPQKLKQQLKLGSYRTAWLLAQRIRDALVQYRRELGRQGRRRGAFETLAGYTPASAQNRPNFDDALNALIAAKPAVGAPIEQSALLPQRRIELPLSPK
ncbi:MAG: transposase [Hyphomicrobiales bacterium]|nr:transposase [Hyphomicrobiales bacterium]